MTSHRRPPIPKEHGAWATLYAPFLIVALAFGRVELRLLLFFVAVTALFLSHEPLSRLLRMDPTSTAASRKQFWRAWLLTYWAAALGAGIPLVWMFQLWALLGLGAGAVVLLALHAVLVTRRQDRTFWGEVLGVLGLTSTAPSSYLVLTSRLDNQALFLWLLNVLYFTSGIFYVKMRVSRHVGKPEATGRTLQCALYHLALLAMVLYFASQGWLTSLGVLAFLPLVLRAFWGMGVRPARLHLRRIGYTELGLTLLFVALIAGQFQGIGETAAPDPSIRARQETLRLAPRPLRPPASATPFPNELDA